MALAVTLQINFRDAKNKRSSTDIKIPTGFSIAQYQEFAVAACQVVANSNMGEIVSASLNFGLDLSGLGLKTVITTFADVAVKAFQGFRSAVTGLQRRLKVPTFDETFMIAGTDQIDTAATEVAAWISYLEDGSDVGGTTIQPVDKRGNDLTTPTFSRELHVRDTG